MSTIFFVTVVANDEMMIIFGKFFAFPRFFALIIEFLPHFVKTVAAQQHPMIQNNDNDDDYYRLFSFGMTTQPHTTPIYMYVNAVSPIRNGTLMGPTRSSHT